jgi:hypothetical protein
LAPLIGLLPFIAPPGFVAGLITGFVAVLPALPLTGVMPGLTDPAAPVTPEG